MKELRRLLDAKRRELAQLTREVTALERCLVEMGNGRDVVPQRAASVPVDPEKRRRSEEARARLSAAATARWEALRKKTAKRRRALARLSQ
jgi:hypothetical protein